jgi:peptidoglycan-associated lipoprotein
LHFLPQEKIYGGLTMVRLLKIYSILFVVLAAFFVLSSCAKKQITPADTEGAGYETEADRRAAEAARQREAEQSRSFQEESLEDSRREGSRTEDAIAAAAAAFENADIYFEFDSANLSAEAQEILREKVQWLKQNPRSRVIIEGHCDERGTNEYNLALGERRAQSAQQYLISLGIDESRLATVSYGEERPLDPEGTESAWAKNRRAHFVIEK